MTHSKTHLLVGANSTIAKAYAEKLLASGAHLHLVARSLPSLEDHFKEALDEGRVTLSAADVLDPDALKGAVLNADLSADRPLCSLTYFPGSIPLKSFGAFSKEDIEQEMGVNTYGAFYSAQAALPLLKKAAQETGSPSSITFISSVAARKGFMKHALIAMAKAGLEGLSVALAKELAPHVRVNCIAPSLTDTSLAKPLLSAEAVAKSLAAAHPLKRLGTADDIASALMFLNSDQASWITGQTLGIDGGRSSLD